MMNPDFNSGEFFFTLFFRILFFISVNPRALRGEC